MSELSKEELKVLTRLVSNLLSSAVEAGVDPGFLETIYYKLLDQLGDDDDVN